MSADHALSMFATTAQYATPERFATPERRAPGGAPHP
jgi:hypothetical protein